MIDQLKELKPGAFLVRPYEEYSVLISAVREAGRGYALFTPFKEVCMVYRAEPIESPEDQMAVGESKFIELYADAIRFCDAARKRSKRGVSKAKLSMRTIDGGHLITRIS